ncbi:MAG: adenine phosphoribosyltransferase [Bacteroidota bacterium]
MNQEEAINYLKGITRSIEDYPKKGIVFRDLTTIFQDPRAMSLSLDLMTGFLRDKDANMLKFDKLAGIEARGFLLAGAISGRLGGGVIMMRKPGKLPYKKRRIAYQLEYGVDALEIHEDAIKPGEKVVLIDDLLATGGTAEAGCKLVEELGGKVIKVLFLVELPDLGGRKRLDRYNIESVFSFEGK